MNNLMVIELKDVLKLYKRGTEDVRAVNGISMSVEKGCFLAIVGPSGSGKSTLLNIIGCVDNCTSGMVKIEGQDVTFANQSIFTKIRRHTIGFIFQQFFLIPTLTALENVQIPGLFANNQEREKKAKELLNLVGLSRRIYHLPSQLSGGEMQRVAIARALINSPEILLADEPTGNLDSLNANAIFNIFKELNKNKGLTVVVVTHNLELTGDSERIVFLEDGKIKNP